MKPEYAIWIAENVEGTGKDRCGHYAVLMSDAFPELTFIGGTYTCPIEGEWGHCFTVTEYGEIVDPTAFQFESYGHGQYNFWKSFSDAEIEWLKNPQGEPPRQCLPQLKEMCSAEVLNRFHLNNELWKQSHNDLDYWEQQWLNDAVIKNLAFNALKLSRACEFMQRRIATERLLCFTSGTLPHAVGVPLISAD